MEYLHQILRWTHIAFGFAGLIFFWIPVFARKGGRGHRRFGALFALCAYGVALSAGLAILLRLLEARGPTTPETRAFLLFLGYLALVVFTLVRHAERVVQTRTEPSAIRTPFHRALALAGPLGSAAVAILAFFPWSALSPVLLGLSPVGLLVGLSMRQYLKDPGGEPMGWFYAHMGAMLGAGTAFHTAFFVFGSRAFISLELGGMWSLLPWILPVLIGTVGSFLWERHYRRRFAPGSRRLSAERRLA